MLLEKTDTFIFIINLNFKTVNKDIITYTLKKFYAGMEAIRWRFMFTRQR